MLNIGPTSLTACNVLDQRDLFEKFCLWIRRFVKWWERRVGILEITQNVWMDTRLAYGWALQKREAGGRPRKWSWLKTMGKEPFPYGIADQLAAMDWPSRVVFAFVTLG